MKKIFTLSFYLLSLSFHQAQAQDLLEALKDHLYKAEGCSKDFMKYQVASQTPIDIGSAISKGRDLNSLCQKGSKSYNQEECFAHYNSTQAFQNLSEKFNIPQSFLKDILPDFPYNKIQYTKKYDPSIISKNESGRFSYTPKAPRLYTSDPKTIDWSQAKEQGENIENYFKIFNGRIFIPTSCNWRIQTATSFKERVDGASCKVELSQYFIHGSSSFSGDINPADISKNTSEQIKKCIEDAGGGFKVIAAELFVSSDGTHSSTVTSQEINEKLTKARITALTPHLDLIFKKDLASIVTKDSKLTITPGYNRYGTSGEDDIPTPPTISQKEKDKLYSDLSQYRRATLSIYLSKPGESTFNKTDAQENISLECQMGILSCVRHPEAMQTTVYNLQDEPKAFDVDPELQAQAIGQ